VILTFAIFVAGAAVSLYASWLLVSRIERLGGRFGVTEAMLGLFAALAADAPEITSAISALVGHQQEVGAGVVVGSNVFNLAALLGLGAVAAGWIALHRRVVALTGAVSLWIAAICVVTVLGWVAPVGGLVLVLCALCPYIWLAASRHRSRVGRWLSTAMHEEELELHPALVPVLDRADVPVAIGALLVVIVASVVMERAATNLGAHFSVPDIVVGGVVLAAVTSLPNAVAAVYLARRGRGTAMLSTALNSNALNIAIGLLLPASFVGLGATSGREVLVALWYLGLTAVVLVLAYLDRGLRRTTGILILVGYVLFVIALIDSTHRRESALVLAGPAILLTAWTAVLALTPRRDRHPKGESNFHPMASNGKRVLSVLYFIHRDKGGFSALEAVEQSVVVAALYDDDLLAVRDSAIHEEVGKFPAAAFSSDVHDEDTDPFAFGGVKNAFGAGHFFFPVDACGAEPFRAAANNGDKNLLIRQVIFFKHGVVMGIDIHSPQEDPRHHGVRALTDGH